MPSRSRGSSKRCSRCELPPPPQPDDRPEGRGGDLRVQDFEAQQATLACRHCGQVGALTTERQANNNGLRVVCARCPGKFDPIGGHAYLDQKARPSTRVPLSHPEESVAATWARWLNRCAGCGVSGDDLDALGRGRQRQHAPPLQSVGGDESKTTLVPFCTLCHQHVTANQQDVARLVARLAQRRAVRPLTAIERGAFEEPA